MKKQPVLRRMIDELIQGKVPRHELKGGLLLRFAQANDDQPNRLLCYRPGVKPSLTELGVVRRELEGLLSRPIRGSDYWQWNRYWCFTFSWQPINLAEQRVLFPKETALTGR